MKRIQLYHKILELTPSKKEKLNLSFEQSQTACKKKPHK